MRGYLKRMDTSWVGLLLGRRKNKAFETKFCFREEMYVYSCSGTPGMRTEFYLWCPINWTLIKLLLSE